MVEWKMRAVLNFYLDKEVSIAWGGRDENQDPFQWIDSSEFVQLNNSFTSNTVPVEFFFVPLIRGMGEGGALSQTADWLGYTMDGMLVHRRAHTHTHWHTLQSVRQHCCPLSHRGPVNVNKYFII